MMKTQRKIDPNDLFYVMAVVEAPLTESGSVWHEFLMIDVGLGFAGPAIKAGTMSDN